MKYSPHKYQLYAIDYLMKHPTSAIFLDCGLGKTSIALTAVADLLFDSFEVSRVLVVAPLRVARDTWSAEIEKWDHLAHLTFAVAVGSAPERKAALMRRADITIINRENLEWLVEKSGALFDYDMVVLDELSSFKNHRSKRFKVMCKVRPMLKRITGLTGTPASNGLMDLWAEFRILDMGKRLGRFIGAYREAYFEPDRRRGNQVFTYKPLPCAEDAIYKQIDDITISMKATDHLKMPRLVQTEVEVVMSAEEQEAYNQMKSELVLSLGDHEVTSANSAALAGKLSQMANGAVYDDGGVEVCFHERKLDALEDIIESACGKPLLVAYWFKHDLKRIEERLKKLKINYSCLSTSASIKAWNEGRIPVALIHPASAGHGLNLQSGGSTIVWFGLTWSLELYQQANARLWRQGQKDQTVVVLHIVCKNTIDGRILAALKAKDKEQADLIEAVRACL